MIGSRNQDRRILRTGLDIVNRRIRIQRFELGFVSIAAAVIRSPVPANRKQVIAQHVHDAGMLMHGAEQIGALICDRTNQQATV